MRVKRGTGHVKRRKNLLKKTKGFRWGRKNKVRLAHTAALKAGVHAYRGRKQKKRDTRSVWNIRINAGAREHELTYSKLMPLLKKSKIELNRKMLAELAANHPAAFKALIAKVK